jgi:hypothetical protein
MSEELTTKDEEAESSEFTTRDMRLACTLIARGHRVVPNGLEKDDYNTMSFTFFEDEVQDDIP